MIQRIFFIFTLLLFCLSSINILALSSTFNPEIVVSDQDLYSLPLAYSSADKIQAYLESTGSILANYTDIVGLVDSGSTNYSGTDDLLLDGVFASIPVNLRPREVMQKPFGGKPMRAADIIWKIARESFGNSCRIDYRSSPYIAKTDICIDNTKNPINPGYILALIQKESGLIYGACSKNDNQNSPGCQPTTFRLERATGYYCFETQDRSKSCYDENPNWKYFKGFFKQIYHAIRLVRIREGTCKVGGNIAFKSSNGTFQVGNTVTINNQPIILRNGITCAMYIYTPHTSAQQLHWSIMRQIRADQNLVEVVGIDSSYTPASMKTTN